MPEGTDLRSGSVALFFATAGVLHFAFPNTYLKIMPPWLPWPGALVALSGVAEIAGGLGLLVPRWRKWAAYWLIAVLVTVFPANIYMAVAHLPLSGWLGERWAQWGRLPLQFLLIWWVWRARSTQTSLERAR